MSGSRRRPDGQGRNAVRRSSNMRAESENKGEITGISTGSVITVTVEG